MVSRWMVVWLLAGGLEFAFQSALSAAAPKPKSSKVGKEGKINFEKQVQPLLSQYCYGCHGEKKKGDLDLRIYTNTQLVVKDQSVFEKVLKNLQAHEMPPENKPQPTPAER